MYAVQIEKFSVGSITRHAVGTPTVFHVETRDRSGRVFTVAHRYSDFVALHTELAPGVEFPIPKRTLKEKMAHGESSLRERMRGLEHYLKCAVAAAGETLTLPPALRLFLGIPEASPSERTDANCDR